MARNSSALAASRVALVATIRMRVGAELARSAAAYPASATRVRSIAARGEPAGAVDALAEPHDLHPPDRRPGGRRSAGRTSATSSRTELVPQSIAATRVIGPPITHRCSSIRVLPRVLGLTRSRSRNSATPSS